MTCTDTPARRKIAEIADYIRDWMREPQHAETVAEHLFYAAEPREGEFHLELAGRYTVSGNALPFEVSVGDSLDDYQPDDYPPEALGRDA